jgi:hypothetical protein
MKPWIGYLSALAFRIDAGIGGRTDVKHKLILIYGEIHIMVLFIIILKRKEGN